MNGISYRLDEFIKKVDRRCLMVDASAGLALGALSGLEDFTADVRPLLGLVDGLVCSPGQMRRLADLQRGEAALLVRVDWTNTLRGTDFVLPPEKAKRLPILPPDDARDLGATGMVITFLLGYEEEVEAECLRNTVQWAVRGKQVGLPLVVEVRPTGPRVSLPGKAVELGASYALEGGADVIVLPYPGKRSLETIAEFVSVPWLVRPTSLENAPSELEEALACEATGLWLDHSIFATPNPAAALSEFKLRVHQLTAV